MSREFLLLGLFVSVLTLVAVDSVCLGFDDLPVVVNGSLVHLVGDIEIEGNTSLLFEDKIISFQGYSLDLWDEATLTTRNCELLGRGIVRAWNNSRISAISSEWGTKANNWVKLQMRDNSSLLAVSSSLGRSSGFPGSIKTTGSLDLVTSSFNGMDVISVKDINIFNSSIRPRESLEVNANSFTMDFSRIGIEQYIQEILITHLKARKMHFRETEIFSKVISLDAKEYVVIEFDTAIRAISPASGSDRSTAIGIYSPNITVRQSVLESRTRGLTSAVQLEGDTILVDQSQIYATGQGTYLSRTGLAMLGTHIMVNNSHCEYGYGHSYNKMTVRGESAKIHNSKIFGIGTFDETIYDFKAEYEDVVNTTISLPGPRPPPYFGDINFTLPNNIYAGEKYEVQIKWKYSTKSHSFYESFKYFEVHIKAENGTSVTSYIGQSIRFTQKIREVNLSYAFNASTPGNYSIIIISDSPKRSEIDRTEFTVQQNQTKKEYDPNGGKNQTSTNTPIENRSLTILIILTTTITLLFLGWLNHQGHRKSAE